MHFSRTWVALALALVAWASEARAANGDLVAVLDVFADAESIPERDVGVLTDALRSQTKKALGQGFRVMTQETAAELLPAAELKCLAGQCLAVIGRKLQAKYVIGATLRKVGKTFVLTVEAYESASSELLGSEQLKGTDSGKLLDFVDRDFPGLVQAWLVNRRVQRGVNETVIAAPKPYEPPPETIGIVTFSSDVPGTEIALDGRPLCTAPCSRHVGAGKHAWEARTDGYEVKSGSVAVTAGQVQSVPVRSQARFGVLTVDSSPAEQAVELDGRPIGTTALSHRVFDEKRHKLRVSGPCVQAQEIDVALSIGGETRKSFDLKPAMKKLDVSLNMGVDPRSVEVFVDGKRVGTAKDALVVPVCSQQVRLVPENPDFAEATFDLAREQRSVSADFEGSCLRQRKDHVIEFRNANLSGVELGAVAGLSGGQLGAGRSPYAGGSGQMSLGLRLYGGPVVEWRVSGGGGFDGNSNVLFAHAGGQLSVRRWSDGSFTGLSAGAGLRSLPESSSLSQPYFKASIDLGNITPFNFMGEKFGGFLSTHSLGVAATLDAAGRPESFWFTLTTGGAVVGRDSWAWPIVALYPFVGTLFLLHPVFGVMSMFQDNIGQKVTCAAPERRSAEPSSIVRRAKAGEARGERGSLAVGARVRRGPDWKWEDQDGKGPGTIVAAVDADSWVRVQWDAGGTNAYRWGANGAYDLAVIDEVADGRKATPLARFAKSRVSDSAPSLYKAADRQVPSVGARVRRGPSWKWGDQDGNGLGTITTGPDSDSWVRVQWDAGGTNAYRWNVNGAYDVEIVTDGQASDQGGGRVDQARKSGRWTGKRVRRGADWKWGDQDGGGLGRITTESITDGGWIEVRWDSGSSNNYRVGAQGKYDLEFVEEP